MSTKTEVEDIQPLLGDGTHVRNRKPVKADDDTTWLTAPYADWNPNLPYGGKVYLAKRKKPDTLFVRVVEVCTVGVGICYYSTIGSQ